ncbi:MAG TPA: hemerythrin domain-containing protein [Bacteroidia bacterium]|jgi:hemerythrin-like domain-containing protein|nr:hemerythrin domain-containing protein [Bacteroidia bacterium]
MSTINKNDPIKRVAEKLAQDEGMSPMSPPDYKDAPAKPAEIPFDELPVSIQKLVKEHQEVLEQINSFENAMQEFRSSNYHYTPELSKQFSKFFEYMDKHILPHHEKEEKFLFPILEKYLIKSGEHSKYMSSGNYETSVDLMEDDHLKFLQVASVVFNLLGIYVRIPDPTSRDIIADIVYSKSIEMIELLKTHIYQEDTIIFPQCAKFFSSEEISFINSKIK